MADHLKYDGPEVRSRGTKNGDVAIEVLDLNAPLIRGWREHKIRQVRHLRAEIGKLADDRRKVEQKLRTEKDSGMIRDLTTVLDQLSLHAQEAAEDLQRIAP